MAGTKATELIKLVTYCNSMNAYCANLSCTHPHTHNQKRKNSRIVSSQNAVAVVKPTANESM